jgi:hypothetical protein
MRAVVEALLHITIDHPPVSRRHVVTRRLDGLGCPTSRTDPVTVVGNARSAAWAHDRQHRLRDAAIKSGGHTEPARAAAQLGSRDRAPGCGTVRALEPRLSDGGPGLPEGPRRRRSSRRRRGPLDGLGPASTRRGGALCAAPPPAPCRSVVRWAPPPPIHRSVPDDIGRRTPTLPRPRSTASHAVRVPRAGRLPPAAFRSHLAVGPLAVRLGVPVITVSTGLTPSSHVPVGFRLPVASARHGATRHAWRTAG